MVTSIAEAQNPLGLVHVNGTLYCTPNGSSGANGNTTPVFPNAVVRVTCATYVVANSPSNAATTTTGEYRVVLIPRPDATVASIVSNCRIFVPTPLSNCNPVLPSSAGLVSNLRFVRTVSISFSRVTYMVAAGFTVQT
ncbi:hypothetical protein BUALT_BualtUnG0004000 [Buddleja alternifolia]|uniref:Uncharacterized protein n=1 Tax=Buddleja alternifolia TaxID=168488 RepID=A0AAV6W0R7_9LAMI|nr:hypothetical protein BUALT_BualtUnG0004000 [Buddleja alternifolia]